MSIYCISVSADSIKTVIRLPEAVGRWGGLGEREEGGWGYETGKKVIGWGGLAFMGGEIVSGKERNWAF